MNIAKDSVLEIIEKHYSLKCPHCNNATSLSAISIPHYHSLMRYRVNKIGIVYKCNSCDEPVFLKFHVFRYNPEYSRIELLDDYETVENPTETFDFEYLPEAVKSDFTEALQCYSIKAYNAFAAMCRRSIQSAASSLGTIGKDKVQKQIDEMKEMTEIDDDTYNILKQIIIDGHDGAHPHLPILSEPRANILLELMKDVMYQLFVRKGKLAHAAALRKQQISSNKSI